MVWTLISYSQVEVPLPPSKFGYCVGIIEDNQGQREMVQINKKYLSNITIGMQGDIEILQQKNDQITYFIPFGYKNEEISRSKVALITGSSRGIGKAIAIELALNGFDIVINNSNKSEEAHKVVLEIQKIGQTAIYIKADVSDPQQVEKMVETVIQNFNKIDVLVNNAGIVRDKMSENMTIENWNLVLNINLTSMFICSKSVLKYMKKRSEGKIINISSVVGQMGNIGQANYSAAKGGAIALTKTLAKEYARYNIQVNGIAPGFIETDMLAGIPKPFLQKILDQIPLDRLGKPEEVAKLVSFLASDSSNYITGQVININGGLYM